MGRLQAFLLLALSLVLTSLRRIFSRRGVGIAAFRENYDADGLPPVNLEERQRLTSFQRCIACGLCDRGEAERIAASGGTYRGVMSLMLTASRSMPDYRAVAHAFAQVPEEVLAQKELLCPTRVPMRQIARFVIDKAAAVGGPLPVPPRLSAAGLVVTSEAQRTSSSLGATPNAAR